MKFITASFGSLIPRKTINKTNFIWNHNVIAKSPQSKHPIRKDHKSPWVHIQWDDDNNRKSVTFYCLFNIIEYIPFGLSLDNKMFSLFHSILSAYQKLEKNPLNKTKPNRYTLLRKWVGRPEKMSISFNIKGWRRMFLEKNPLG